MLYLIVLIPPILFAISNILDKRLTVGEDADSSPASLMLIGGFFNFVLALLALGFLIFQDSFFFSWSLFFNGLIFSIAIWLYLVGLKKDDTDRVIVWFQTIPIFGLIGGFVFLQEKLEIFSIIAIFLVVFGSMIMSIRKGAMNKKLVLIMLLSSLLIAANDLIFASFGRGLNPMSAIYSDLMGKAFWCLIFVFAPGAIAGFLVGLKTKLGLQAFNEIIFALADASVDVAKLFAPVAIVQSLAATQPVFVFLIALVLGIFYPNFLQEVFEKTNLKNKIVGLILVTVGSIILAIKLI